MLSLSRSLQVMVASVVIGVGCTALVGCNSNQRAESVPNSASLATQGREQLTFTAPRDGMVYVEDEQDHKLVYSGEMRKGQKLSLDSTKTDNQIMLDGQTVVDRTLRAAHDYKVYFEDRAMLHRDRMDNSSSSDRM